jgi:hypothetical protein
MGDRSKFDNTRGIEVRLSIQICYLFWNYDLGTI